MNVVKTTYPTLKLTSFSVHTIFTNSSLCAFTQPQFILKSFMFLKLLLSFTICSGKICIMRPSSTILDLAVSPLLDFKAPFRTIKLAPVTGT